MKIRLGFVSNSSSASFVILNFLDGKQLLSDEEISKLRSYGFWDSCQRDPFRWEESEPRCKVCTPEKGECWSFANERYLRYFISCNEDEVIKFLIENNIPFIAAIDYDTKLLVYKRNAEKVVTLENEGIKYIWQPHRKEIPEPQYFKRKKKEDEWDQESEESYKTVTYNQKDDLI